MVLVLDKYPLLLLAGLLLPILCCWKAAKESKPAAERAIIIALLIRTCSRACTSWKHVSLCARDAVAKKPAALTDCPLQSSTLVCNIPGARMYSNPGKKKALSIPPLTTPFIPWDEESSECFLKNCPKESSSFLVAEPCNLLFENNSESMYFIGCPPTAALSREDGGESSK